MNATLGVRNLRVDCIVGVYSEERRSPRQLLFDIEFEYDIAKIAESDDLRDGVDYDRVVGLVKDHAAYRKYHTLEALVSGTGNLLAEAYPFLERLRVEVHKPASVPDAKETWAAVELTG